MADGMCSRQSDAKVFPKLAVAEKSWPIIYKTPVEKFYQVDPCTPVRGRIVTCGPYWQTENLGLIDTAFAEVQKSHPFATLKIYGEGVPCGKLQNQITDVMKSFLMSHLKLEVICACSTTQIVYCFLVAKACWRYEECLHWCEVMAAGVPDDLTDCPCGGQGAI